MATLRLIVTDVDASVTFCTNALGFDLVEHFGPAIAIVAKGDLALWLAGPLASASKPMPDGSQPAPGGWARPVIDTDDIAADVARLTAAGQRFRNAIVAGPGGQQILLIDPSGNLIELFQPA